MEIKMYVFSLFCSLRNRWKESNFTSTEEDLLSCLEAVLDEPEVNEALSKTSKKKNKQKK